MLIFEGKNRVTSPYRSADRPTHTGLDIVGEDSRDVRAILDGTVTLTQVWDGISKKDMQSYGNLVIVQLADGRYTYYAHLQTIDVQMGQKVKAGDKLGIMGSTGNSTGAHTHFELRAANRTILNPTAVLGIPNAKGVYTSEDYQNGWKQKAGKWYYYKSGQPVKSQWIKDIDENWYYLGPDGSMLTGWQEIGGKTYYLNPKRYKDKPTGAMLLTDTSGAVTKP